MPDRYLKLTMALRSLHRQTYRLDAIYLSLPAVSRRLGITYDSLPTEINDLCTVVECEDYGPMTKIVGGLLQETDPNTVIITFDDDRIYPSSLVSLLMAHHRAYPNSAIGSSGMLLRYDCPFCAITPNEENFLYRISKFSVPVTGRPVDSIYGYPGALYVRKFFPPSESLMEDFLSYALVNDNMLMNDDIVISGYLSMKNIERRIFHDIPEVIHAIPLDSDRRIRSPNEISYNVDHFFQRMNGAIRTSKSLGMYSNLEPMDFSESIFGVCAIAIIALIVIISLVIYVLLV